jgi:hypothetical protein
MAQTGRQILSFFREAPEDSFFFIHRYLVFAGD